MSSFRLDPDGLAREAAHLRDLASDVNRADAYVSANVRLSPSGPEVLTRVMPGVTATHDALTGALHILQNFLTGSAVGIQAASDLYASTDTTSATTLDATYPDAPPRPVWDPSGVPSDTRPSPSPGRESQAWDEYVEDHGVDTGPREPVVMGPASPSPPQPGPAPTTAPVGPPSPTTTPTPQPSPGPSPVPAGHAEGPK